MTLVIRDSRAPSGSAMLSVSRHLLTVGLTVCLPSCSSSSGGPCSSHAGTYAVEVTEPAVVACMLPAQQFSGNDPDAAFLLSLTHLQCDGRAHTADDFCTTSYDLTCLGKTVGEVRWSHDGTTASGALTQTILHPDGSVKCTNFINITATKIQ